MTAPVLLWFRHDLRLSDNQALIAAAATGQALQAVYILDDAAAAQWQAGGASRWWLHHSLAALGNSLAAGGGQLLLRRGDTLTELASLVADTGATAIFWNRIHEPWADQLDSQLRQAFGAELELQCFGGQLLYEPEHIRNGSGQPFRVFTPFWKHCRQQAVPAPPQSFPEQIRFVSSATLPASDLLADWKLKPAHPDWAADFNRHWQPGEAGGHAALESFCKLGLQDYGVARDRPDQAGTSRLSPHLHFGELSPAQVWHTVQQVTAGHSRLARGAEHFLRELGWREFAHHLLHHWPTLPTTPFRGNFKNFPWKNDAQALRLWQQGRTGYPIVDAGMRELWQTGWMHNRVRMIAASFLIKHLLIPWQQGEAWFHDTLVDADLANNSAGWQWVAGCGADAAPYFRIFNPIIQGKKFDPEGTYVRRWVPELRELPAELIHEPWKRSTGLDGATPAYPPPLIDHAFARQRALAAFAVAK